MPWIWSVREIYECFCRFWFGINQQSIKHVKCTALQSSFFHFLLFRKLVFLYVLMAVAKVCGSDWLKKQNATIQLLRLDFMLVFAIAVHTLESQLRSGTNPNSVLFTPPKLIMGAFLSWRFFFLSQHASLSLPLLLSLPCWEDKGTPTLSQLESIYNEVTMRLAWSAFSLETLAPAGEALRHFGVLCLNFYLECFPQIPNCSACDHVTSLFYQLYNRVDTRCVASLNRFILFPTLMFGR